MVCQRCGVEDWYWMISVEETTAGHEWVKTAYCWGCKQKLGEVARGKA